VITILVSYSEVNHLGLHQTITPQVKGEWTILGALSIMHFGMRIKLYIFRTLIEVFLGTLAVLYGVMFIIQWIQVGALLTINDADIIFLAMVPMSAFVIPMGLIFSTLIVLEKFSSESEIIAMKACGVRSRSIFAPIIFLSVAAMLVHLSISTFMGPLSMKTIQTRLLQIAPQRVFSFLKEREFDDTFKDIIIYVESVNQRQREFKGVFIETSGTERAVISAEKGTLEATPGAIMMKLDKGSIFMSTKTVDRYLTFDEYSFSLEADLTSQLHIKTFDTATQDEFKQLMKKNHDPKLIKEYHNRISFPVLNIILALVGISFGVVSPRSPRFTGFITGIGTIVGYYLIYIMADRAVKGQILDPVFGAWLPNIIFCLGLALVWGYQRVISRKGGI
jgi:lipopolysaccharide export system permease protein